MRCERSASAFPPTSSLCAFNENCILNCVRLKITSSDSKTMNLFSPFIFSLFSGFLLQWAVWINFLYEFLVFCFEIFKGTWKCAMYNEREKNLYTKVIMNFFLLCSCRMSRIIWCIEMLQQQWWQCAVIDSRESSHLEYHERYLIFKLHREMHFTALSTIVELFHVLKLLRELCSSALCF